MVKNNTLLFCFDNHIRKYINCISNMPENGKCAIIVATKILYRADIFITYRKISNS